MRILPFDHLEYPTRLRRAFEEPPQLWVKGDLTERGVHVAIVGARKATPVGLEYARALAQRVAKAGAVVVSGGAMGIDAAAHEGALDVEGVTWAVLPSGHRRPFPSDHAALFERIAKQKGAAISRFPPEMGSLPGNFHARNRLLAALSDVVVIVQARDGSGTRHAADCARQLGRELWAVTTAPWLDGDGFEGCSLEMIMKERPARPLWSTEEFLRAVGLDGSSPLRTPPVRRVNDNENKVLDCLRGREVHVDEIVLTTGLSVSQVTTALLTMALEDVVVEARERWYRANHPA